MQLADASVWIDGKEFNLASAENNRIVFPGRHPAARRFEASGNFGTIHGWATVCEVAPCVFVFAVTDAMRLGAIRMTARLKPGAEAVEQLRGMAIDPTAEDYAAAAKIIG